MVSEWMVTGNITEYVRRNAGNHLKLVGYNHTTICGYLLSAVQIVDAVEGLKHLVHGYLKGVRLSAIIPRPLLM